MGSGLILLVIVLAWLAVLVPMALRSYDVSSSFGGVDRFSVAMRVLSRRGRGEAADAPAEEVVEPATVRVTRPATPVTAPDLTERLLGPAVREPAVARAPRPSSSARAAALQRRQRLSLGLVALAALTLILGLLGVPGMLLVHAAVDGLLLAFGVHLRRQAAARARRLAAAPAPVRAPRAAPHDRVRVDPVEVAARRSTSHGESVVRPGTPLRPPVHVAGVPDRMPPRITPRTAPERLPATGTDVAPARGAVGAPWSPVPVPVPTYVTAPVVPRPAAAVEADLAEAEKDLGIVDDGPQLDRILDRRRAVNDW